jgi:Toprim domain
VPSPKKIETPLAGGATKGAAIKLSEAGSMLGIAEGIETALAVREATGLPTWSCISAGGLKKVVLPPAVKDVYIWADYDVSTDGQPGASGQDAAMTAAERFHAEGRQVFVLLPESEGDFLDVLVREGPAALTEALAAAGPWDPPPVLPPPPAPPRRLGEAARRQALQETHATFRKWLGESYDLDVLDAALAVAAAKRLDGDPPWLLIISGSGDAKTETVMALRGAGAVVVSTIASEGALLSASAQHTRAKDATGGLLRQIGSRGLLAIKDVHSLRRSEHPDPGPRRAPRDPRRQMAKEHGHGRGADAGVDRPPGRRGGRHHRLGCRARRRGGHG